MYDHQAKKLNEQGTFKEIVVEISARQLSAKSETLRQMSMFLTQAVFMEVCVHPKPGLVTRHGGGAHTDMSILTFAAGSAVLAKAVSDLQILGMKHNGNYQELFGKVRRYGVSAEQELLRVTKGVNTQRGILFAGGLLAAAAGAAMNKGLDSKALCSIVAEMTQGLTENELAGLQADRPLTAGERLYQAYGITGIRGEVEAGFPSVRQNGLPGLKEAFAKGAGLNDALVHALVHLMTVVQDSNVIWRGGYAKLPFVQQRARDILAQGSIFTDSGRRLLAESEELFRNERISPGGSADLLSVTAALYLVENKEFPVAII